MKKTWLVLEMIFAFTAVLLVLIACNYMLPKRVDHDIWDIATAFGTVGAAVAAVWIATSEARRRHKADIEVAELTAASMGFRLAYDQAKIQMVVDWLRLAEKIDYPVTEFFKQGQELESVCLWTPGDLLPLIRLPGRCASSLANAADHVRLCEKILKYAPESQFLESSEGRRETARNTCETLLGACRLLQIGMDQCEIAMERLNIDRP